MRPPPATQGRAERRTGGIATGALIARLIDACCRRAISVAVVAGLLSVSSCVYVARHFSIRTDTAALISPDVAWRKHERRFERAFPRAGDDIAVVVDGQTRELADKAVGDLTATLSSRKDLFRTVDRPQGGPFFEREGLLFLSLPELRDTTTSLIAAQPVIGPLAEDPSLRGLLTSLDVGVDGVTQDQTQLSRFETSMRTVADAAEAVEAGRPVFFSWRDLIEGRTSGIAERRRFIEILPKVEYSNAEPGAKAVAAIRLAARDLRLDPAHGVRMRITGAVPMDDDELSTLEEATGPIAALMFVMVLVILYIAVRSPKIILAILATVVAGLCLTSALGLLIYGRFNLISAAFLPLFVGLGVDFAIQFSVRFQSEILDEPDGAKALAFAGGQMGEGLALAAAATSIGFFAFLPTSYEGVSELGLIAGLGMLIAFLLTITLLPALLLLLKARGHVAETGLRHLVMADRRVQRRKRRILAGAGTLCVFALAALPLLRFDFDPLRLRDRSTESVSTYLELARSNDTTPNTLDVLSPNVGAAADVAKRLSRLPEVYRAVTLASFVPEQQQAKLALLSDASALMGPTIDPFDVSPPPSDRDLVQSLRATAERLRQAAADGRLGAGAQARRLAGFLTRAASTDPGTRARLQQTFVAGLPTVLGQVRSALQAQPVSLASLPADLVDAWVSGDGARIQVFPAGDPQDPVAIGRFVRAVERTASDVTGGPITVRESGKTILRAFTEAGLLSLLAIIGLLFLALRDVRAVALSLAPVILSAVLSAGTCVLLRQDINLENIIALPLLLGVGVSFNIYFVVGWRSGTTNLLGSSLARAVLFSALTTASAFGALGLSAHPGTASMGVLLLISLFWTLSTTLLVQPALLGAFAARRSVDAPSPVQSARS